MSGTLSIRNRQRTRRVNTRHLRRLARGLLCDLLPRENFDLGICIVDAAEMTRLNETFLRHRGATDVIAFDYGFGVPPSGGADGQRRGGATALATSNRLKSELRTLHGEIVLCVDAAVSQARRFRTTWQSELVRYLIHGILHLRGFDDRKAAARRAMKRQEDRLLSQLVEHFPLREL